MAWISANAGTILVGGLLIIVVAVVIRKIIRDKKNGKSSCGCNCAGCTNKDCYHE